MDEDEATPAPADSAPESIDETFAERISRLEQQVADLMNATAEHDEDIEELADERSDTTGNGTDSGPPTADATADTPEGTPPTEPDAKPRNIHWLFGKLW